MTKLSIPAYQTKQEIYRDLDNTLSYIAREDIFLAHFKTLEFIAEENIHKVVEGFSIRNSDIQIAGYDVPVFPDLQYKLATCIFSENEKTLGLRKHIHLPKTNLPTITIGKKIYQGKDEVTFNFYRRNGPPNITLIDDFVLRFDSSFLPHDVIVKDSDQSIWLFIVFEHCSNTDLELIKQFYDCKTIYDYRPND